MVSGWAYKDHGVQKRNGSKSPASLLPCGSFRCAETNRELWKSICEARNNCRWAEGEKVEGCHDWSKLSKWLACDQGLWVISTSFRLLILYIYIYITLLLSWWLWLCVVGKLLKIWTHCLRVQISSCLFFINVLMMLSVKLFVFSLNVKCYFYMSKTSTKLTINLFLF